MAALGSFLLLATFVVCAYAAAASVAGARQRSRRLIESGVGASYLVCALMTAASAVMINAFLTNDFTIKYVVQESEVTQPLFYKITAYWGGLDGSILFWVFLLSVFGSTAIYVNRERHRELIPYVVAIISGVEMFFLYVMVVHKNPFSTYLTSAPADGSGLNPLLQNYWMVIHPPSLYTGFVGMTIPYAFGMAALITGHLDDSWLRAVRRWTMVAWLFLTFGLTLGMIWAYEELGWGGFWGWDPVENAGLLPWFTATAFLHSVMVQERRSMLRVWNVTLVVVTFFLTIFATFMTRSGVVSSVHAFGEDRELAWLFTGFMVATLTFSFGWVIYRLPLLRSRNELDSWLSREAAFLVNNWILLFSAFFILFATMFPTLSEALTKQRLTVAGPFYTKWMAPIGLILLFLTGVGPLLGWRKSTASNLQRQFMWPGLAAVLTAVVLLPFGFHLWPTGLCFALCALVTTTIVQEFWRGANVRRGSTHTDLLTALVGLISRNKRRYGGYIVHAGIVLMFLGFAGQSYKLDQQLLMKPGEQAKIGRYSIQYDRIGVGDDGQKQIVSAYLKVFEDGKLIDEATPAKWSFHKHSQEPPTTEVWIRRRPAEDLYIVLAAYDASTQAASIQLTVNPLVNWVWFGFGVIAFGTGIALMPERAFEFATARLPASAATTTLLLLIFVFGSAGRVLAQHEESPKFAPGVPKNDLEKQLQHEIVCMCGTCGRRVIAECDCTVPNVGAQDMRNEVSMLVASGKAHDEVIQYYVAKYGSQEPLASPIDKGFNRLAWFVPYAVGAAGVVGIGFAALRWSRRETAASEPAPAVDADVADRLDDELRNLD